MRNFTQKLTALAAVGWLSLTTALAGEQFVPKEYSYKNVGMSSQSTINIPMTDLFTYPDGMDATANLDEAGVKAEFEFTDENVVGLYKYEYYSFGKVQQLYLMRKGGYVTGPADVKVKLTYNGETVENTLDIDIVSLIAQDDEYTADLGQALMMPVLNNDNFMKNGDKANATIEILQAPVNGQATIVEGADGAQDTIKYVQNEGLDNYSFDELKYKVTLGEETSEATVKINIHKNAYASRVIDFLPAPGQFTNQLSTSDAAEGTLGTKGGTLSLGSFGGYVIYGFDQPIMNNPKNPYGVDFTIKGNSFVANIYGVWTEPGAVQVCQRRTRSGGTLVRTGRFGLLVEYDQAECPDDLLQPELRQALHRTLDTEIHGQGRERTDGSRCRADQPVPPAILLSRPVRFRLRPRLCNFRRSYYP